MIMTTTMTPTAEAGSRGLRGRVLFVLIMQCLVVLVCVGITTATAIAVNERSLRTATVERVMGVAESLAALDQVREALLLPPDRATEALQPLAEIVRSASGVDYVVIMDADGVRRTHPSPDEIGGQVSTDPTEVLDGRTYLGTQEGTLGPTLRAKVPVFDGDVVVGAVSVGILESELAADFTDALWSLLPWVFASVLGGCLLSAALTSLVRRRVRRLEQQGRELQAQRRVAAALRDQTHEFHTRLHVIRGLVAEDDRQAALDYIGTIVEVTGVHTLGGEIGDPAARAILDAVAARLHVRGAELVVDDASAAVPGALDDDALIVLSNLCRNAAEACDRRVRVLVHADGSSICLAVGDDGAGIAPDQAARVFERGFSSKGGQRGVGLDIVRRVVGARDGSIEVGVSSDGGALFTVDLPAHGGAGVSP